MHKCMRMRNISNRNEFIAAFCLFFVSSSHVLNELMSLFCPKSIPLIGRIQATDILSMEAIKRVIFPISLSLVQCAVTGFPFSTTLTPTVSG